jgi:NTP pyrophosphatase (non-canonical NTP hydrolase)
MSEFKEYLRTSLGELRPYVPGEDVSNVSVAQVDRDNGSPKAGDMIARNPKNHADQWLVAEQYFKDNYGNAVSHADIFEGYVESNFGLVAENWDRTMTVMCCGAAGETGEVLEHVKKVIRDNDANFDTYPKREEALLEFGDAFHYLTRLYRLFGFTYEQIVQANMKKLDERYHRSASAKPTDLAA